MVLKLFPLSFLMTTLFIICNCFGFRLYLAILRAHSHAVLLELYVVPGSNPGKPQARALPIMLYIQTIVFVY